jgi:hypothetical protein
MWYWKLNSKISSRYFSTAALACQDLDRFPYLLSPRLISLIQVPESETETYLNIGVEVHNGRYFPSLTFFPQERGLTGIFNQIIDDFVSINRMSSASFVDRVQLMRKFGRANE